MENKFNIHIEYYKMGKDFVFLVTGGEAHIGATATAYYQDGLIKINLHELPHHKEGQLTKEFAVLAATELKHTSTVITGIHIDNATKEQIQEIVVFVRKAMKDKIAEIKKIKGLN